MTISSNIKDKLRNIPDVPGCYIMRDRSGRIIYVGKALSLKKRLRSYFGKAALKSAPYKLRSLIKSIRDIDIITARNEAEALLTEGKLIKEYKPRYNVSFRDDKRFPLLRSDPNQPFPKFSVFRIERDDGALYFGPYASSPATRATLDFIEKKFGLRKCAPLIPDSGTYKHCHNDIIRFCSAPCTGKITRVEYKARFEEACAFLRGERPGYFKDLREQMEAASTALNFERASALRDIMMLLRKTVEQKARIMPTPEMKRQDAARGMEELQGVLKLDHLPRVMEGYDISNISGTYAVASMVRFENGLPHRNKYRRFKIKTIKTSDDARMIAEVVKRRFSRLLEEGEINPDLILVDGGIQQLNAARAELENLGLINIPAAGLAKRFEEIFLPAPADDPAKKSAVRQPPDTAYNRREFVGRVSDPASPEKQASWNNKQQPLRLPKDSKALKLLQRIRDEAHRFALDYHHRLRSKRIKESALDEIHGIGEKRKRILLEHFGSVSRIRKAGADQIAQVPGIGKELAQLIMRALCRPGL